MSWRVATLCDERAFGGPTRKQVAMYLADKASDDGRGIWCSKYTIATFTEISLATIKRIVRDFLARGILVETGTKRCRHGETKVYAIDLAAVARLPSLRQGEGPKETGVTTNPVPSEPPTRVTTTRVPGSSRPPNLPRTVPEPPCSTGAATIELDGFEAFWQAYPPDRRRSRRAAAQLFADVVADGADPADVTSAAEAYREATAGHTRTRVCFADNWLRADRWKAHLADCRGDAEAKIETTRRALSQVAGWVKSRSSICSRLSRVQIDGVLGLGLVTEAELRAAGVAP